MLKFGHGLCKLVLLMAFILVLPYGIQAANITQEINDGQKNLITEKMILNYLFCTDDNKLKLDRVELQKNLGLNEDQMKALEDLAMQEGMEIGKLKKASLADKAFNLSMEQMLSRHEIIVQNLLGEKYDAFVQWLNQWWNEEKQFRTQWLAQKRAEGPPDNSGMDIKSVDDRELVYATQYDGNTDDEVALPDKYVKFANRGWTSSIPSSYRSYYDDPPYTVNVYYETSGLSVLGVLVNEVGPWNENDNYWDTANSTPDRRMFDDLDLGEPEAEAAYYDDYNDGEDQFGRTVANPAGIDLTPEIASDLGLGYLQNAWVWVRYSDLP